MVMAGKGSFVMNEVWEFFTVITGDVCHLFTIFIAKLDELKDAAIKQLRKSNLEIECDIEFLIVYKFTHKLLFTKC